jgi:hypothetical protein
LTIASGDTAIGGAGRAPDEIASTGSYARAKTDFIIGEKTQINKIAFYSHRE